MLNKKGVITIAIMGIVVTLVAILMVVIPVVTTKYHIQRYLQIEYKYNNAEMIVLNLLSYSDIRHDLGLYVSGLLTNAQAAGAPFNREALPAKLSGMLDKMVPDGGCYALYYDVQPYSSQEGDWTLITKRDNEASGAACKVDDLLNVGVAFVPVPQGEPQIILVLKTL